MDGQTFDVPPVDTNDSICREHDYLYTVTSRERADAIASARFTSEFYNNPSLFGAAAALYFSAVGADKGWDDWVFPPLAEPSPPDDILPTYDDIAGGFVNIKP